MKTAKDDAEDLLEKVDRLYSMVEDTPRGDLVKSFFLPLLEDPDLGGNYVADTVQLVRSEGIVEIDVVYEHILLCVGECAMAWLLAIDNQTELAYQRIYAGTLRFAVALAASEADRARKPIDAAGLNLKRHARNHELRDFARELARAGNYRSSHNASHKIAEAVRAKAKELGTALSEDRAQKTIYDWVRTDPLKHH